MPLLCHRGCGGIGCQLHPLKEKYFMRDKSGDSYSWPLHYAFLCIWHSSTVNLQFNGSQWTVNLYPLLPKSVVNVVNEDHKKSREKWEAIVIREKEEATEMPRQGQSIRNRLTGTDWQRHWQRQTDKDTLTKTNRQRQIDKDRPTKTDWWRLTDKDWPIETDW